MSDKTKVVLHHRHYGIHSYRDECVIPVDPKEIYLGRDSINEQLLIDNLPDGFLRCAPRRCLLAIEDRSFKYTGGYASTGQDGLSLFLNWAKYFDAYSITLCEVEE